jgi:hypothetical protein
MTPARAWAEGTNVLASFRLNPARTEATLLILLKDTLNYLDCSKTIKADRDLLDAVHYLRDEFPAMKLEEWHIICYRLKTGEYPVQYERLKLPELVAIFRQYEGERAEVREANWNEIKKATPDTLSDDQLQALYAKYEQQRQAQKEDLAKAQAIKSVPTDKRGRWQAIPYTEPERDGEEGGHDVLSIREAPSDRPPGDG